MARSSKFSQPVEAIEIVSRSGSGTLLPPEVIEGGRARVEGGESVEQVALDLVIEDMSLTRVGDDELRSAAQHPETPLHVAADQHLAKLTVAVRYAFARGRKALGKNANVDAAVQAIRDALEAVLPATLRKVMASGGEAGLTMLKAQLKTAEEFRTAKDTGKASFDMSFDAKSQAVIDWADRHAAELIDGITETTREDINNAVAAHAEDGDWEEYYAEVLNAVGDESRADLIARTEVMTAANEGQREAWNQASTNGLLSGDEQVAWIATDINPCPECEELDGATRDLDGEYPDPGGDGPPLHPNCRCTEGIVS